MEALDLDKLLLIPAAVPPHKDLPEDAPAPEHRLEMTEKMADALLLPGVAEVSSIELERRGKSYTVDTLREIHEQYPQAELWLLMGTDMFLTLHQWRDPAAIAKLAGICAFGRRAGEGETFFAPQRAYLEKTYGARTIAIDIPGLVDIASTRLRELLPLGKGGDYLSSAVYGYILRERLYGTHADLKHLDLPELRACSYSMVLQKRVAHIRGTEEEAARLARRWGADEMRLRHAAILHDCTKYLTLEEHLALCGKYGVELDELERSNEKLLHAKTGAVQARYLFGEDDEVYDAIFYHTTGRADMSLAGKIVYVADYIEPNRSFPEVEEMRAAAYQDLDRAMAIGTGLAIQEMEERGKTIHHDTLEAYECYRKGTGT